MIISPDGCYHYSVTWSAARQTSRGIEYLPGTIITARWGPILHTGGDGPNQHVDSLMASIRESLPRGDGYSISITSITPLAAPPIDQQLATIAAAQ